MSATLDWFAGFFDFFWVSILLLAPMLLLGLLLAGILHVLVSRESVLRWLKNDDLKSVCLSAGIGVPMPLCSCSVVPVVTEMRRKGASRASCMSFLITAPETGADSILVTQAFFGFVPAITRPIVSLITAVVSGLACIGLIRNSPSGEIPDAQDAKDAHTPELPTCSHDCHDSGESHTPLIPGSADCHVAPGHLKTVAIKWFRSLLGKPAMHPQDMRQPHAEGPDFPTIVKHVLRYGFVHLADDILFALLVGIALGALLYLMIPSDLMLGDTARWLSYPVMVLLGVPVYICASASTPIAAALVAKGISPGAALIFLMTGPATNTGTIAIVVKQFGARFSSIYVGGVISVSLACGLLIDVLILLSGFSVSLNMEASHTPAIMLLQWSGAFLLLALIVWRARYGALGSGFREMVANLRLTRTQGATIRSRR